MEQSHSPSDVLSGLRENPSALMSARLAVKWSPAPPPSVDSDVGEEWTPAEQPWGGWEESSGQRGGRLGFFLCCLKGRKGEEGVRGVAAALLIRHSNSAEWRERKPSGTIHLVASLQVVAMRLGAPWLTAILPLAHVFARASASS